MIHRIPSAHEWYFNVLKMKKSSSVQSSDFNAYVSFVVINSTQQRKVVWLCYMAMSSWHNMGLWWHNTLMGQQRAAGQIEEEVLCWGIKEVQKGRRNWMWHACSFTKFIMAIKKCRRARSSSRVNWKLIRAKGKPFYTWKCGFDITLQKDRLFFVIAA